MVDPAAPAPAPKKFSLFIVVSNDGLAASPKTQVKLWGDSTEVFNCTNAPAAKGKNIKVVSIPALQPGQSWTKTVAGFSSSSAQGTAQAFVNFDCKILNQTADTQDSITYLTNTTTADLQVLAVSSSAGPTKKYPEDSTHGYGDGVSMYVETGAEFTFKFFVTNQGNKAAKVGKVNVWYNLASRLPDTDFANPCAATTGFNQTFDIKDTLQPGKGKWFTTPKKLLTGPTTASVPTPVGIRTELRPSYYAAIVVSAGDCSAAPSKKNYYPRGFDDWSYRAFSTKTPVWSIDDGSFHATGKGKAAPTVGSAATCKYTLRNIGTGPGAPGTIVLFPNKTAIPAGTYPWNCSTSTTGTGFHSIVKKGKVQPGKVVQVSMTKVSTLTTQAATDVDAVVFPDSKCETTNVNKDVAPLLYPLEPVWAVAAA